MSVSELEACLVNHRHKDGLLRCTKALKKRSDDPILLLYKAKFLRSLDRKDESKTVVDALFARKPPLTDPFVLQQVNHFLHGCNADTWPRPLTDGPQVDKLWANAVATVTKQHQVKELHDTRFEYAVTNRLWRDAGTALIALRKAEPQNLNYRYTHVAIQQIIADTDKDQNVARLNRTLAARTLPSLTCRSQEDLRLQLIVLRRQGLIKELADLIMTRVVNDATLSSWEVTREYVAALIETRQWDDLIAYCGKLLIDRGKGSTQPYSVMVNARARQDWGMWKAYLEACVEVGDYSDLGLEPDQYPSASDSDKRLLALARVWVAQATLVRLENQTPAMNGTLAATFPPYRYLDTVRTYFDVFKTYSFCFADLGDFVAGLSPSDALEFRKHVAESSRSTGLGCPENDPQDVKQWLLVETNVLQFEYLLTIGGTADLSQGFLEAFACNAIRLADLGVDTSGIPPVANFIPASALIRLHQKDPSGPHLLQAACVLEYPARWGMSQAKVMLVYIYAALGMYSAAFLAYESMAIKEIQHETMSHAIFTRIAMNHPFGESTAKVGMYREPFDQIKDALSMYDRTDDRLASVQTAALDTGRFDLLSELEEFRNTIDHSLVRRILILQYRRIAQLTDRQITGETGHMIQPRSKFPSRYLRSILANMTTGAEHWCSELLDRRDFDGCYNLEQLHREKPLQKRLYCDGRLPKARWISYALHIDHVWSILQDYTDVVIEPPGSTADFLAEPDISEEITPAEQALFSHWKMLHTASMGVCRPGSLPRDELTRAISDLLEDVDRYPVHLVLDHETVPGLAPSSAVIEPYFLLLELLKATRLLCTVATDVNKNKRRGEKTAQKDVDAIAAAATRHFDAVRAHAARQKSKLSLRATQQFIGQGAVGAALKGYLRSWLEEQRNQPLLEEMADKFVAAAEDAWDGVLRVRLL